MNKELNELIEKVFKETGIKEMNMSCDTPERIDSPPPTGGEITFYFAEGHAPSIQKVKRAIEIIDDTVDQKESGDKLGNVLRY